MSDVRQDVAVGAVKITPPALALSSGLTTDHVIALLTILYLLLMVGHTAWKWWTQRVDRERELLRDEIQNRQSGKARIAALGLTAGLSLVASFEGLRTVAYADPVGIPTVCYGHTNGVRLDMQLDEQRCRQLLEAEFWAAVLAVHRCSPVPLAPNELGALASAVYNLGPGLVCDPARSTLARRLGDGDVRGACEQLPRWDKARVAGVLVPLPGLTRRRAAEMRLCLDQVTA